MKIGFVLMDSYWQKKGIGSSRIRGRWVIKYLNGIENVEAEEFIQGVQYDVIVFQKAYWKEMARAFKGMKILDICDPDWLDGAEVVSFCRDMDFITVPTEGMKEAISAFTDKPIHVIPDGEDFGVLPEPKIHEGRAKSVVWFGYSGNMDTLYPTFYSLKKLGLILKVVSDGHLNTSECKVENIRWEEETCDEEYQRADFALLPEKKGGRFKYKSDNKTIHSMALGLPVAKTKEELERFMEEGDRILESKTKLQQVRNENSVELSAKKLYEHICQYQHQETPTIE